MKLLRRNAVWNPVDPVRFHDLARKLAAGPEWEYTSLTDRLNRPSSSTVVVRSGESCLLWDRSGFLFARFDGSPPTEMPRPRPQPRSIMGLYRDVAECRRLLRITTGDTVEYLLMKRPAAPVSLRLPPSLQAVQLQPKDHSDVLPLESAYQREEVLLQGQLLHNTAISRHLEWKLQHHIGVGIRHNGQLIAKAHTNARGIRCCQVGGVYTVPAYRGRGCGELVMRCLLRAVQATRMTTSLFVKPENIPGRRLYSRLGFETVGRYAIAYV